MLELTLCLIPGPAVLFVVGSSLRYSRASGLSAALGILTGNALYFAASGFGVVSLLIASHEMFMLLKWAGAIYLAVLGVRSLLGGARQGFEMGLDPGTSTSRRTWAGGLLTQISNPKALLFFASILPQFVDPRGNVVGQLIILGVASLVVEACVLSMYSFTARRLQEVSAAKSTALWFERIGGAMMLGVAARVAVE